MDKELKKLRDKVERVLKQWEYTRNSDKKLTWYVWEEFYGIPDTINYSNFMILPSQSSIKRIRAMFNRVGKYLPTSEAVARLRRLNMDNWREAMGYNVPDKSGQINLIQSIDK